MLKMMPALQVGVRGLLKITLQVGGDPGATGGHECRQSQAAPIFGDRRKTGLFPQEVGEEPILSVILGGGRTCPPAITGTG
jgi:hypothetical protein